MQGTLALTGAADFSSTLDISGAITSTAGARNTFPYASSTALTASSPRKPLIPHESCRITPSVSASSTSATVAAAPPARAGPASASARLASRTTLAGERTRAPRPQVRCPGTTARMHAAARGLVRRRPAGAAGVPGSVRPWLCRAGGAAAELAEELADASNCPAVMFGVARAHAHILKSEGRAEASRERARMALAIARDQGITRESLRSQLDSSFRQKAAEKHIPLKWVRPFQTVVDSQVDYVFDHPRMSAERAQVNWTHMCQSQGGE